MSAGRTEAIMVVPSLQYENGLQERWTGIGRRGRTAQNMAAIALTGVLLSSCAVEGGSLPEGPIECNGVPEAVTVDKGSIKTVDIVDGAESLGAVILEYPGDVIVNWRAEAGAPIDYDSLPALLGSQEDASFGIATTPNDTATIFLSGGALGGASAVTEVRCTPG